MSAAGWRGRHGESAAGWWGRQGPPWRKAAPAFPGAAVRKARTSPTRKVPMKCLRLRSEQPQMLPAWQPTGSRWLTGSDSLPTARLHSPALPSPKCRFPPFFARPPLANSLNLPVSVALAPSLRAAPGSGADRVGDGAVHHPQPPRRPLLDHELHLPAPAGARAGGGGSWTSKAADSRLRPARAGDEGSPRGRRRTPASRRCWTRLFESRIAQIARRQKAAIRAELRGAQ